MDQNRIAFIAASTMLVGAALVKRQKTINKRHIRQAQLKLDTEKKLAELKWAADRVIDDINEGRFKNIDGVMESFRFYQIIAAQD